MKLSKLIEILKETMSYNGDMDVVGIIDGEVFDELELNCAGEDSPLYIELYKKQNQEGAK